MVKLIKPNIILGLAEEPREAYFEGNKGLKRSIVKAEIFMK